MFTGIVQGCGTVERFIKTASGSRLDVRAPKNFPVIPAGGSVAVNGACLTAVRRSGKILSFDVVSETIRRTNFRDFKKGSRVHLEPALRWNGRVEGHFVQGHVDATGIVRKIIRRKADYSFEISAGP